MRRILLLIPTTSYRTKAFIEASRSMDVEITVGSDHKSTLAEMNPAGLLALDIFDIDRAVESAWTFSKSYPIDAVIGIDDQSVIAASAIAEELGLPHNTIISVSAARNKYIMREFLSQHKVSQPSYMRISTDEPPEHLSGMVSYPAVLKPVTLSGSRGVIKVNGKDELKGALNRIRKIINSISRKESTQEARSILVEEYIDGNEVAVEGLIIDGNCKALAIFDKPDPLTGPYFEETIYTTPSQLDPDRQLEIVKKLNEAVTAIGLSRGPVHAELRFNDSGVYVIEIAARSIGGYCSQALRFRDVGRDNKSISLEELIIRDALCEGVDTIQPDSQASGVMMIPVPREGTLLGVHGVEAAERVPNITGILLSAHVGQKLIPLPEGGRYPGFIFARAHDPAEVEHALREAHKMLRFDVG